MPDPSQILTRTYAPTGEDITEWERVHGPIRNSEDLIRATEEARARMSVQQRVDLARQQVSAGKPYDLPVGVPTSAVQQPVGTPLPASPTAVSTSPVEAERQLVFITPGEKGPGETRAYIFTPSTRQFENMPKEVEQSVVKIHNQIISSGGDISKYQFSIIEKQTPQSDDVVEVEISAKPISETTSQPALQSTITTHSELEKIYGPTLKELEKEFGPIKPEYRQEALLALSGRDFAAFLKIIQKSQIVATTTTSPESLPSAKVSSDIDITSLEKRIKLAEEFARIREEKWKIPEGIEKEIEEARKDISWFGGLKSAVRELLGGPPMLVFGAIGEVTARAALVKREGLEGIKIIQEYSKFEQLIQKAEDKYIKEQLEESRKQPLSEQLKTLTPSDITRAGVILSSFLLPKIAAPIKAKLTTPRTLITGPKSELVMERLGLKGPPESNLPKLGAETFLEVTEKGDIISGVKFGDVRITGREVKAISETQGLGLERQFGKKTATAVTTESTVERVARGGKKPYGKVMGELYAEKIEGIPQSYGFGHATYITPRGRVISGIVRTRSVSLDALSQEKPFSIVQAESEFITGKESRLVLGQGVSKTFPERSGTAVVEVEDIFGQKKFRAGVTLRKTRSVINLKDVLPRRTTTIDISDVDIITKMKPTDATDRTYLQPIKSFDSKTVGAAKADIYSQASSAVQSVIEASAKDVGKPLVEPKSNIMKSPILTRAHFSQVGTIVEKSTEPVETISQRRKREVGQATYYEPVEKIVQRQQQPVLSVEEVNLGEPQEKLPERPTIRTQIPRQFQEKFPKQELPTREKVKMAFNQLAQTPVIAISPPSATPIRKIPKGMPLPKYPHKERRKFEYALPKFKLGYSEKIHKLIQPEAVLTTLVGRKKK